MSKPNQIENHKKSKRQSIIDLLVERTQSSEVLFQSGDDDYFTVHLRSGPGNEVGVFSVMTDVGYNKQLDMLKKTLASRPKALAVSELNTHSILDNEYMIPYRVRLDHIKKYTTHCIM